MGRFDRDALLKWLAARGAHANVLARIRTWQLRPGDELLPGLPPWEFSDVYLVLCGLLAQTTDPVVREDRLDALKSQALVLGYRERDFESLLSYTLRITERRLRAFAVLGLGLDATIDEIKATHRTLAKTFHPDRISTIDPRTQSGATRVLARLNEARTLLLRPTDEVVLAGDDDIPLGEPRFESEDAPTEEYTHLDDESADLSSGAIFEGLSEDDLSESALQTEDEATVLNDADPSKHRPDEYLRGTRSVRNDPLDAPDPGQLPPRSGALKVRLVTTGR